MAHYNIRIKPLIRTQASCTLSVCAAHELRFFQMPFVWPTHRTTDDTIDPMRVQIQFG
jgi:hypothetical protein